MSSIEVLNNQPNRPRVEIDLVIGPWRVRTVRSPYLIQQILNLREQCFKRTFKVDRFEQQADHLIVEDLSDHHKICGVYRLTLQGPGVIFDTEEDFKISVGSPTSAKSKLNKLEVAWACTAPGYREGHVIHMLWRGLAAYIKVAQVTLIFGETSVSEGQTTILKDISEYVRSQGQELDSQTQCSKKKLETTNSVQSLRRKMPPLLRLYLMAGALVLLQPIFDPDTNCYDYLTVLDVDGSSDFVKNHFEL